MCRTTMKMRKKKSEKKEQKIKWWKLRKDKAKAKHKAYEELNDRLYTKEGEKDLYRLVRQKTQAGICSR